MKASKLREQTVEELRQVANDLAKEITTLKIKRGTGESGEQPMRARTLGRDLARVWTVLRERELKHG